MRAAHTCAVLIKFLTMGWEFPYVAGISAGSTETVNYISKDVDRSRGSFIDFPGDPRFGSPMSWLSGRGYFNAEYIYQIAGRPGGLLPFDYETFARSPQEMRIGATRTDNGAQVWFSRDDVHDVDDLMIRVRASSTMPGLMPPVTIDGVEYVDGAVGPSGGIPIDVAMADGWDRFFIVLTRQAGYRKEPVKHPRAVAQMFRSRPAVAEAIMARPKRYNETLDMVAQLEAEGRAYVFRPETMPIGNRERDVTTLRRVHAEGMRQANAEIPAWRDFLGL